MLHVTRNTWPNCALSGGPNYVTQARWTTIKWFQNALNAYVEYYPEYSVLVQGKLIKKTVNKVLSFRPELHAPE
jgi:hypothetical protein